jgi:hypothetical protein
MMDTEKRATTPVHYVMVGGVQVWSRYQKGHEIALGARVVERLPAAMRADIAELWCDSKAQYVFTVEMRPGKDVARLTLPIAAAISDLLIEMNTGHNGVYVGTTADADPDWPE